MFCQTTEMSCICSLARKPSGGLPFPFTTTNSTLYFLPFLGFTTWTCFLLIGFSSVLLYITRVTSSLSSRDRLPSPYTSLKDNNGMGLDDHLIALTQAVCLYDQDFPRHRLSPRHQHKRHICQSQNPPLHVLACGRVSVWEV